MTISPTGRGHPSAGHVRFQPGVADHGVGGGRPYPGGLLARRRKTMMIEGMRQSGEGLMEPHCIGHGGERSTLCHHSQGCGGEGWHGIAHGGSERAVVAETLWES